jgi:subtilisin family serine protease
LKEGVLRRFVFQTFGRSRHTQDSPVMPDVFLRYIRLSEKQAAGTSVKSELIDVLLTPWSGVRPGQIAHALNERLHRDNTRLQRSARVALSGSRVVASASFDTLARHIVQMAGWWLRLFRNGMKRRAGGSLDGLGAREIDALAHKEFDAAFAIIRKRIDEAGAVKGPGLHIELARFGALIGFIALLREAGTAKSKAQLATLAYKLGAPSLADEEERDLLADGLAAQEDTGAVLTADEKRILHKMYARAQELLRPEHYGFHNGIFLVSLNRPAAQSVFESRATVKADAAQNVFKVDTTGIVFAVIDGGIDATHPGFVDRGNDRWSTYLEGSRSNGQPPEDELILQASRVKRTYDFTILRDIVANAGFMDDPKSIPSGVPNRDTIMRLARNRANKKALSALSSRMANARDLDWELVSPLIEIPHVLPKTRAGARSLAGATVSYTPPGTDHGTHVAGILAGCRENDPDTGGRNLIGMCPELSLYDLRVFDQTGRGDEFAILCAIEFVGWLNRDRNTPVVHGVNLSLALAHDVDAFACGQTPICEACNHLVGAGTVVVVAAGNTGFDGGPSLERRSIGNGYRAISITDPGNAERVITVGSTHRRDPHLYGVSYFSARGPTGDGRRKPDLLAPGEKITSFTPSGGSRRMDGTSMAAPHVSGAAALLMARYPELIGRPGRIKEILMNTATDLKREPSFQGAGLVDTLRALQSV